MHCCTSVCSQAVLIASGQKQAPSASNRSPDAQNVAFCVRDFHDGVEPVSHVKRLIHRV